MPDRRRACRNGVGERVPGLPVMLAEKFRQEPSELNFFALMGAIAGALGPIDGRGQEKDYTQYSSEPGIKLAADLFRELTQGRRSDSGR